MDFGFKSHPGLLKSINQDRIFINERLNLFLLADGLSGNQAGEIASDLAVTVINQIIENNLLQCSDVSETIKNSVLQANNEIYERSINDINLKGMRTTVVLLLIKNGKAYISNIGDSRIYVLRNREIKQLTLDHTLVEDLVRGGNISREKASQHELRHFITKALGSNILSQIEVLEYKTNPDDVFLLCSDGLTNTVKNEEIMKIIYESRDMQNACDNLVNEANSHGGRDNVSTIIIHLT
jgi:protein phosphatase